MMNCIFARQSDPKILLDEVSMLVPFSECLFWFMKTDEPMNAISIFMLAFVTVEFRR